MTIEELYRWAKENDCEKIPIVIVESSSSQEKIMSQENIVICKDQFSIGYNKLCFGSDNVIKLM